MSITRMEEIGCCEEEKLMVKEQKIINIVFKKQTGQDTETWETTEKYCPACGKQLVWCEKYLGENHICIGCRSTFFLPYGIEKSDCEDEQRLVQLRVKGG